MSRSYTSEVKAAVIADYASGLSMKAVSKIHGVAESTLCGWVHEAGVARSNGAGKRLSARQKRDAEFGLHNGHWVPNHRGIQIWQPCFFNSIHDCNINHQETRNAA